MAKQGCSGVLVAEGSLQSAWEDALVAIHHHPESTMPPHHVFHHTVGNGRLFNSNLAQIAALDQPHALIVHIPNTTGNLQTFLQHEVPNHIAACREALPDADPWEVLLVPASVDTSLVTQSRGNPEMRRPRQSWEPCEVTSAYLAIYSHKSIARCDLSHRFLPRHCLGTYSGLGWMPLTAFLPEIWFRLGYLPKFGA